MFKTICPYCGGVCKVTGGEDGNPFNQNRKETTICTTCGRIISESSPLHISDEVLKELTTDADIADDEDDLLDQIMLKISATAEGGGVTRSAEIEVSVADGRYSLGSEYPFGRRDIDQKPPFSLCDITVKENEISIAGETFAIKELPKTITKKLTAYGYGYVPWVETITITISIA